MLRDWFLIKSVLFRYSEFLIEISLIKGKLIRMVIWDYYGIKLSSGIGNKQFSSFYIQALSLIYDLIFSSFWIEPLLNYGLNVSEAQCQYIYEVFDRSWCIRQLRMKEKVQFCCVLLHLNNITESIHYHPSYHRRRRLVIDAAASNDSYSLKKNEDKFKFIVNFKLTYFLFWFWPIV